MSAKDESIDPVLMQKARQITLLAMDVYGVLTDGKLHYGEQGELYKSFSIKDGLGIKLLQRSGVTCAVITGRASSATLHRCKELGIEHVVQGREDKATALRELCETLQIDLEHSAYIGDDWPDIGAIVAAGVGAAVNDAHPEVISRADWVSRTAGGFGAVREFCDLLLQCREQYHQALNTHLE